MAEFFDILSSDGTPTGVIKERNAVHRDGDLHGSVHVWLIRDGRVLLQKRADDKESFPSCYDAACTGHISAGETPVEAAVRETREEISLSLKPNELHFLYDQILTVHQGDFLSNEFNRVYLIDNSVSLDTLDYERGEITELRFFEIEDLKNRLKNKEDGFCMTYTELMRVLDCSANIGLFESGKPF